jgi:hypothetical protein
MNRSLLLWIAALVLVPLVLGPASGGKNVIRNGDFERFTGNEPTGWETTNIPNMLTAVSQSTKSHSGKNAVKCEVKDFYGTKMAGMLCLKDVNVSGDSMQLKGFYLLHSVAGDRGFLSITFKNAGSAIGSLEEFLIQSSGEFVHFSRRAKIPDTTSKMDLHLTLLAGKESAGVHEGSYVIFDDLEFVVLSGKEVKSGP